ncbi:MAG: CBS domain-containing protein [Limnohabitans sp.]
MKTIAQFLSEHNRSVHAVSVDTNVRQALELMAEKNIGALVVLEGQHLVGMFSERDYARKVALKGKSSVDTLVGDIMTAEVISMKAGQSMTECMQTMTDHHIRHLPVLDEQRQLLGLISIGDVVREILQEQSNTIEQLKSYIAN